jgi:hypothetical protein
MGLILDILSLLAYAQCTLTTFFDIELAPKKVVSDCFEIHLKVSIWLFLIFHILLANHTILLKTQHWNQAGAL